MTTEHRVARRHDRGEGIVELRGGAFEIDSFTSPGVRWKTHPNGWCQCPRYEKTGYCVKHPTLAEAVKEARKLWFGKEIAERLVVELCKEIFRPVKYNSKGFPDQHPIDSYSLSLKVEASRYSTPRMILEAKRRHGRILIAYGQRDGRAA